jgi:hypothetical protein
VPGIEGEKIMGSLIRAANKYNKKHRHVTLRGMAECPGSRKNHNKYIYIGNELVGVVICGARNWCVWRLVSKWDASYGRDRHARMYMDRLERVGDFDTWRETRDFIIGPLNDSLLVELGSIRDVNTVQGARNN